MKVGNEPIRHDSPSLASAECVAVRADDDFGADHSGQALRFLGCAAGEVEKEDAPAADSDGAHPPARAEAAPPPAKATDSAPPPLRRAGAAFACLAALTLAGTIALVGPRAWDAGYLLFHPDDTVALAEHAVRTTFDAAVARREIEAALAGNDPELAASFLELAREHRVPLDPDLAARVAAANALEARAAQAAGSFAQGFVTGEARDAVGMAGTALGDLFVFGDVRDALREGGRLVAGENADELLLGLAAVGLAVTAGTYASLGAAAPARVGVSVLKGARRAGRIGSDLAASMARSLRTAVDAPALRMAASPAVLLQPALAVRSVRAAVKLDKAKGLVRLMEDTGRVQAKAGTRAAMDGLRIAERPKDMARVARLAEARGGTTRAILKLGGRAAIALGAAAFNLASWLFSALMAVVGFLSAVKGLTERVTRRWLHWRKAVRARRAAVPSAAIASQAPC
jgi:hypothetical protein